MLNFMLNSTKFHVELHAENCSINSKLHCQNSKINFRLNSKIALAGAIIYLIIYIIY